jgi:hypothetical protein
MTESASPAADPMGRRLRKAFLRTADVIERNPDRFEFGSYAVPSRHDCGTPACALGWICAFMGRRVARKSDNGDPGDVFCVTRGVMNELALFAGAGGGILGGHLLGWRTVCAVERDAYCAAVLAQRQADGCLPLFPIWSDVAPLTADRGEELLTWFRAGFPARTSASPAAETDSTAPDPASGWKWPGSFAKWDRATSTWRTRQCSLLGGLDEFSATWPNSGSMRSGECSVRPTLGASPQRERIWIAAHAQFNRSASAGAKLRPTWRSATARE